MRGQEGAVLDLERVVRGFEVVVGARERVEPRLERAVLGLELLRALRVELVREKQLVLGGLERLQVGEALVLRG